MKKMLVILCILLLLIVPVHGYSLLYEQDSSVFKSTSTAGDPSDHIYFYTADAVGMQNVTHVEITNAHGFLNNATRSGSISGSFYSTDPWMRRAGNATISWAFNSGSGYTAVGTYTIDIHDYDRGTMTGPKTFFFTSSLRTMFTGYVMGTSYTPLTYPNFTTKDYIVTLVPSGNNVYNATYHFYGGQAYNPVTDTPVSDFECNNDWRGDPAPFDLACINNGENYTELPGGCSWTVYWPNSTQTYSDENCDGFEDLTLSTPGRYSVGLNLCNDEDECDFELKDDYVLVLGSIVQPNVTPTVYPNVTPMPLIPTLSPTLAIIINRSDYRSTIEETMIGNLTAPYLDFVDDWTESWISWIDQFSNQVNWPLIRLTEILEEVLETVQDSFDNQYEKAQVFLYWTGLMLAVIPTTVWALINYKMLIEVLKAFMET